MSKVAYVLKEQLNTQQQDIQMLNEQIKSIYSSENLSQNISQKLIFDDDHYTTKTQTNNILTCKRCQQTKIIYRCLSCQLQYYCDECFRMMHVGTKLESHGRQIIQNKDDKLSQIQVNSNIIDFNFNHRQGQKGGNNRNCIFYKESNDHTKTVIIKNLVKDAETKCEIVSFQCHQQTKNIKQKWNNIENQIKKQFTKIKQILNDQLNNVLNTMKFKLQQQLQNVKKIEMITLQTNQIKKCISQNQYQNENLYQQLRKKLKNLYDQFQNFKTNKAKQINLNVSKDIFEQYKTCLLKLEYKSIIGKHKQNKINILSLQQNQNMKSSYIYNNSLNKTILKEKNKFPLNYTKNTDKIKPKKNKNINNNDSCILITEEKYDDTKIKKIRSQTHIPLQSPNNFLNRKNKINNEINSKKNQIKK